jgi:hypothetical protein
LAVGTRVDRCARVFLDPGLYAGRLVTFPKSLACAKPFAAAKG